MDLTDNYTIFHPNTKEYTFFSTPHGSFSKIDDILGLKESLNRFKKTERCLVSYQQPWIKAEPQQQQKQ